MKLPHVDLAVFEQIWLDWLIQPSEERILWAARPTRLYKYDGTPAVLLLALLWIPIAAHVFFTDVVPQGWDTPWQQVYVYAASLAFTLFLVIFPLWKRFKARHTVCVLTDKRAIIQSPRILGRPRYRIFPLHAEMIRDRYVNKHGVGSLVFDYGLAYIGGNNLVSWPIGFINIPGIAKVEHLIFHELFYRHGLQPSIVPERAARSMGTSVLLQLAIGLLILIAGATMWGSIDKLPPGWVCQSVTITYAHADRTPGGDGAFLMQAADGTYFRVPLIGSRGQHAEGSRLSVAYPKGNPLQARIAPSATGQLIIAVILVIIGMVLMGQSLLYYHRERTRNRECA